MFFLLLATAGQKIPVRMVDAVDGYTDETGITSPTIVINKNHSGFAAPNDGTWTETDQSDAPGWYTVTVDATDTATLGEIGIRVTKTGCRSFNDYGYVVTQLGFTAGAIEFTYKLTDADTSDAIVDADVWVTNDESGSNVIASGRTDSSGEVIFYLDAGNNYIWRQKNGYDFDNPDLEVVS